MNRCATPTRERTTERLESDTCPPGRLRSCRLKARDPLTEPIPPGRSDRANLGAASPYIRRPPPSRMTPGISPWASYRRMARTLRPSGKQVRRCRRCLAIAIATGDSSSKHASVHSRSREKLLNERRHEVSAVPAYGYEAGRLHYKRAGDGQGEGSSNAKAQQRGREDQEKRSRSV